MAQWQAGRAHGLPATLPPEPLTSGAQLRSVLMESAVKKLNYFHTVAGTDQVPPQYFVNKRRDDRLDLGSCPPLPHMERTVLPPLAQPSAPAPASGWSPPARPAPGKKLSESSRRVLGHTVVQMASQKDLVSHL